ncbi:MAG TPA: FAD:protein FMN transferase [Sphaerochaeta sp.]|nr:FAD:protein FMN transferase [Sphaerochaeta sp.]
MKRSPIASAIAVLSVIFMVIVALLVLNMRTESTSDTRFCMDTVCSITVYGSKAKAKDAISDSWEVVTLLENRISATLPYSDVCKVNSNPGQWVEVSSMTYDAISFALQMGGTTDGALNCALGSIITLWGIGTDSARVPKQSEIDSLLPFCTTDNVLLKQQGNRLYVQITDSRTQINLGAIGKGYAADLVLQTLRDRGIKNATIDFGGNLYVMGRKPTTFGSRSFKIGLQDPDETRGGYYTAVDVMDKSVVTSGSYERKLVTDDGHVYSHIIDPKTGWSIESNILSVSVIGPSSSVCDALSTSFFVMGPDVAETLLSEEFKDYLAYFLVSDGEDRTLIRVGNSDVLQ